MALTPAEAAAIVERVRIMAEGLLASGHGMAEVGVPELGEVWSLERRGEGERWP
jgi:hypothetical protein